jgi:hypothetical protein
MERDSHNSPSSGRSARPSNKSSAGTKYLIALELIGTQSGWMYTLFGQSKGAVKSENQTNEKYTAGSGRIQLPCTKLVMSAAPRYFAACFRIVKLYQHQRDINANDSAKHGGVRCRTLDLAFGSDGGRASNSGPEFTASTSTLGTDRTNQFVVIWTPVVAAAGWSVRSETSPAAGAGLVRSIQTGQSQTSYIPFPSST